MKREEMLSKIHRFLTDHQIQFKYADSSQDMANKFLSLMEEAGMKPPHVSEEDAQAILHVYYGGYSLYQWDEDLEKDEKVMEMKTRRAESLHQRMQRIKERKK